MVDRLSFLMNPANTVRRISKACSAVKQPLPFARRRRFCLSINENHNFRVSNLLLLEITT